MAQEREELQTAPSLRPCAAFAALPFNPFKNLVNISFTFYPLREYAIICSLKKSIQRQTVALIFLFFHLKMGCEKAEMGAKKGGKGTKKSPKKRKKRGFAWGVPTFYR